jgi:hypothetical protein
MSKGLGVASLSDVGIFGESLGEDGLVGQNLDYGCIVGSSDFDKIFENCFASYSFGLAKDI